MKVPVQLFAKARELAGSERVDIELTVPATVADLKHALRQQCPSLVPMMPQLLVAIGTDYATDDAQIPEGAEVACFPPVSGG